VVSIVSGGGEVCIAYTLVLVNLLDPKHVFWDVCTSIARLTKQPKLVPDIFSKSVPLYQAVGTHEKSFQFDLSI